jgi:RNA recognition motif-containing protein
MSSVSQTLYVNHIGERIGLLELKRTLFSVFSKYGPILEIRAHGGIKRRGQAWITFEELESAVKAKNILDGYFLFDGPISVQFAKRKSHVAQKLNGSYNPYGRKAETISDIEAHELTRGSIPPYFDFDMSSGSDEEAVVFEGIGSTPEIPINDLIPPNKILFVQHLPPEIGEDGIKMLLSMFFGQYSGFVESRIVPMHPDIAFVEFESIEQSTVALNGLHGMDLGNDIRMLIQYAK